MPTGCSAQTAAPTTDCKSQTVRSIPRALGVNPFLTISMFTERVAEQLRAELELPALVTGGEGDDL